MDELVLARSIGCSLLLGGQLKFAATGMELVAMINGLGTQISMKEWSSGAVMENTNQYFFKDHNLVSFEFLFNC